MADIAADVVAQLELVAVAPEVDHDLSMAEELEIVAAAAAGAAVVAVAMVAKNRIASNNSVDIFRIYVFFNFFFCIIEL